MPQYFFRIQDALGEALDDEGAELPDLGSALAHATVGARSMMSESVKDGELDLTAFIEVEDANRTIVARLDFDAAVRIRRR